MMSQTNSKLSIKIGADLAPYKKKLAKLRNMTEKTFGKLKKSSMDIGLGIASITAAGFGGKVFIDKIAETSASIGKLKRALGDTGGSFDSVQKSVEKLNADLGLQNLDEASNRLKKAHRLTKLQGLELRQLAKNTGLINQEFENISEEQALKAQGAILQNFTKDVGLAGDALVYLAGKGGDLKDELADSLHEYSVQFKEAGFGLSQTLGVLEMGLEKGFSIDKVADAFKEGRLKLMGGDKSAVDALDVLGLGDLTKQINEGKLTAADAMSRIFEGLKDKNAAQQFKIGKDIFGTQWEDAGTEAMISALKGMNSNPKITGAAKGLEDKIASGFSFKWKKGLSEAQNATQRLFMSIIPVMLPVVEMFETGASKLSEWSSTYSNLAKLTALAVPALLGLAGAFGVLKIGIGMVSGAFTLLTSPIGLGLGLIVGLSYGLYKLEEKTGALSKAWEGFSEVMGPIWDSLKNLGGEALSIVWETLKDLGSAIGDLFGMTKGDKGDGWVTFGKVIAKGVDIMLLPLKNLFHAIKTIKSAFEGWDSFKASLGDWGSDLADTFGINLSGENPVPEATANFSGQGVPLPTAGTPKQAPVNQGTVYNIGNVV
ncbi:MAG: phage tail tape measure protein, partial [Deltaproteobacteria bacterium]|nr:phage tail tape measure protein [Deltaproteobacteria bacterium]